MKKNIERKNEINYNKFHEKDPLCDLKVVKNKMFGCCDIFMFKHTITRKIRNLQNKKKRQAMKSSTR